MANYTRQLECLNCSQSRSFVHHTETAQHVLSQVDAAKLPRGARITCGRCGSTSVLCSWGDAAPYATLGRVPRRRRSSGVTRTDAQAPVTRTRPQ